MKTLSLLGLILLGLATVLFYINPNFTVMRLFEPITLMGILAGVGLGLIIGGIVGYASKSKAIKIERKNNELKQLQKEKLALEEQAAVLAQQSATQETTNPPV